MKNFILASKSPRRIEILKKYDIDFSIIESDIVEKQECYSSPEALAMSLAFEKAYNVAKENIDSVVLAADTIVTIDGEVLGKPKDDDHACKMLKKLSGKTHRVITGYSIINIEGNIKFVDYDTTHVLFKILSDNDIERYIKTREFEDKAGAYGIQGYGALLVDSIKGGYDNVVGLPINSISDKLKELCNIYLL